MCHNGKNPFRVDTARLLNIDQPFLIVENSGNVNHLTKRITKIPTISANLGRLIIVKHNPGPIFSLLSIIQLNTFIIMLLILLFYVIGLEQRDSDLSHFQHREVSLRYGDSGVLLVVEI